jgi:hypothetical protein
MEICDANGIAARIVCHVDVHSEVSDYRAIYLKLDDRQSSHINDIRILFSGSNIIVCVDSIQFHNVGSARREIQKFEECGV